MKYLTLVLSITLVNQCFGALVRYGILVSQVENEQQENFCIRYFPELYNLSSDLSASPWYKFRDLIDLTPVETCDPDQTDLDVVRKKIGLVSTDETDANCTVDVRANILESKGALGTLSDGTVSLKFNSSTSEPTKHFVAEFYYSDTKEKILKIKAEHPNATFTVYGPDDPDRSFDASIVIIFSMAVFTVAMGSLWSGYTKHHLRTQQNSRSSSLHTQDHQHRLPSDQDESAEGQGRGQVQEEVSVKLTPLWVLFFVFCMCGMLVLLYFFFDQLVYVIIAMFVLASIIATYSCFEPLVLMSYEAWPRVPVLQLPRCNMYLCVMHMELRQFLLLCISVTLSIVWVVYRNEYWAWILQDFLGILFSINMLRVLRLPSLMICTILLSILFFYDIFFVFITPLITNDGKSIMVEVATGGSTGEQLPMVLKVPHMNENPLRACWIPYSMLGFGDILVPGLLLSYCHSYDLHAQTPWKLYWVVANITYALSLIVCFFGLFLMDYAQPALLYIVPGTLIPIISIAFCRGDLKEMWEGDKEEMEEETQSRKNTAEVQDEEQGKTGDDDEEDLANEEDEAASESPKVEEGQPKVNQEDAQKLIQ